MKSIRHIFLPLLFVSVFAFSCKQKIDVEVPGGHPVLVVEAEVTTELDSSYVKLTKTVDYYSTDPYPAYTNATVTVNGIPFYYVRNGIYKPTAPFKGDTGKVYTLNILADGKQYTSVSKLERMFKVDTTFQTFRPAEGFIKEGYAISYVGFDDRPPIEYTYFRFGKFDTITQADSLRNSKILFDNSQTPIGTYYPFELPFTRYQKGETAVMIFRSVGKAMHDFIDAYNSQTSGAPGPFQVPPANLPTNITGGAVGYFATYDVVRKHHKVY